MRRTTRIVETLVLCSKESLYIVVERTQTQSSVVPYIYDQSVCTLTCTRHRLASVFLEKLVEVSEVGVWYIKLKKKVDECDEQSSGKLPTLEARHKFLVKLAFRHLSGNLQGR